MRIATGDDAEQKKMTKIKIIKIIKWSKERNICYDAFTWRETDGFLFQTIRAVVGEIVHIREKLTGIINHDWVSVPLVYTQV